MPKLDLFLGSDVGICKEVCLFPLKTDRVCREEDEKIGPAKAVLCCKKVDKSQIIFGRKNGFFGVFDRKVRSSASVKLSSSSIVGVGQALNGSIVVGSQSGEIFIGSKLSNKVKPEEDSFNVSGYSFKQHTDFKPGSDSEKLVVNRNLFCTGGKENDLKVFDLDKPALPIFMAKNVKNDWLELRVPIWVTDMVFNTENPNTITVATGHKQIRLYDIRSGQRRPVQDVNYLENPILSLSEVPGDSMKILAGNSAGFIGLIDFRMDKQPVKAYHGVSGSVRSLTFIESTNYFISGSMDQFIRVHDYKTKSVLYSAYTKSPICSMELFSCDIVKKYGPNFDLTPLKDALELKKKMKEGDDEVLSTRPKKRKFEKSETFDDLRRDKDFGRMKIVRDKTTKTKKHFKL